MIVTSNFLSRSSPKTKKPSFETLTSFFPIIIFEPGSVFPVIRWPWRNLPLNSIEYDGGLIIVVSKTKSSENPSQKKQWTWAEIKKLKPSEYDRLEKDIDTAHREGRIV